MHKIGLGQHPGQHFVDLGLGSPPRPPGRIGRRFGAGLGSAPALQQVIPSMGKEGDRRPSF
jgi:hypothetical protein